MGAWAQTERFVCASESSTWSEAHSRKYRLILDRHSRRKLPQTRQGFRARSIVLRDLTVRSDAVSREDTVCTLKKSGFASDENGLARSLFERGQWRFGV
jgi:hypothetical protein